MGRWPKGLGGGTAHAEAGKVTRKGWRRRKQQRLVKVRGPRQGQAPGAEQSDSVLTSHCCENTLKTTT